VSIPEATPSSAISRLATRRGRKRMRAARFRCKMSGVAMFQGRALADINLTGHPLGEALEAFISRRDPTLENVQIRRATPTGDVETRVQPHKRWYEVLFEVDDKPDEDEDEDDDRYAARKKAEAKAKAAEKARVKEWPPRNKGLFPPSEASRQSDS
jgi:hypothetical protein